MQLYSNDAPSETRQLQIEDSALSEYQHFFYGSKQDTIPILFLARYWKEFDLFRPFVEEAITLVETEVFQTTPIFNGMPLQATMTLLEAKKLKGFVRYRFELLLPNDNSIRQTFIKRVEK